MKKNILELCLSPDLGGLEIYVKKCSQSLKHNIFNVINTNGKLKDSFENQNTLFLPRKRGLFILQNASKIAKFIDDNDIDIIHFHWTKDGPLAVASKLISKKKPILIQSRHMQMTRFKDDFYHRFIYKHIDMMFAATNEVKDQINKFIPKDIVPKVQTIYPGADDIEYLYEEETDKIKTQYKMDDKFVISLVGRIEPFKGQYLLIEAIKYLKDQGIEDIKAYLIGHFMNDEYKKELSLMVEKYALQDNISFVGFVSNPQNIIQASDICVLTTIEETFGMVLVEAMMSKKAVIGSNKGGVLEIIDDQENGLLFESGNPTDLAEKIKYLYENKDIANQMGMSGEKKAKTKFSNQKQFQKISDIFSSI